METLTECSIIKLATLINRIPIKPLTYEEIVIFVKQTTCTAQLL